MGDPRILLRIRAGNSTVLLVGVIIELYRLQRAVGFNKHGCKARVAARQGDVATGIKEAVWCMGMVYSFDPYDEKSKNSCIC